MRPYFPLFIPLAAAAALTSCGPASAPGACRSLKDAVGDRFTVGAAVVTRQMTGEDSVGAAVLRRHFNSVVDENRMKCETIHPFEDVYNFAGGDSIAQFAEENHMELIGHCLVWHSQCAPWFFVDSAGRDVSADVLRQRIREHIFTVVGRYRGRVKGWDVCNEVIVEDGSFRDSPLYRIMGPEFIYASLQYAHEADPDAELYLNDYGMSVAGRRDGYLALIDSVRVRGLRLDGIGMQGHMGMDYPSLGEFEKSLVAFASKGVKVMVTEWDMSALPTVSQSANVSDTVASAQDPYPAALPDSVARVWNARMSAFWDLFLRHSDKISRVTAWGVTDANSWKNDFPVVGRHDYPLLFDRGGRPKPFLRDFLEGRDGE